MRPDQYDLTYEQWNALMVIADCSRQLGLLEIEKELFKEDKSPKPLCDFIKKIRETAEKLKRSDVLEILYFSGLIYA